MGRSKRHAGGSPKPSPNSTTKKVQPKKPRPSTQQLTRSIKDNINEEANAFEQEGQDQHPQQGFRTSSLPAGILERRVGGTSKGRRTQRLVASDAETEEGDVDDVVHVVPDSIFPEHSVAPSDAETVESDGVEVNVNSPPKCGDGTPVQRHATKHTTETGFGTYVEGLGTPPPLPSTQDLESFEPPSFEDLMQPLESESDSDLEAPFGNKAYHCNRNVGYGLLDHNTQCPPHSAAEMPSQFEPITLSDEDEDGINASPQSEDELETPMTMQPPANSSKRGLGGSQKNRVSPRASTYVPRTNGGKVLTAGGVKSMLTSDNVVPPMAGPTPGRRCSTPGSTIWKAKKVPSAPTGSTTPTELQRHLLKPGKHLLKPVQSDSHWRSKNAADPSCRGVATGCHEDMPKARVSNGTVITPDMGIRHGLPRDSVGNKAGKATPGDVGNRMAKQTTQSTRVTTAALTKMVPQGRGDSAAEERNHTTSLTPTMPKEQNGATTSRGQEQKPPTKPASATPKLVYNRGSSKSTSAGPSRVTKASGKENLQNIGPDMVQERSPATVVPTSDELEQTRAASKTIATKTAITKKHSKVTDGTEITKAPRETHKGPITANANIVANPSTHQASTSRLALTAGELRRRRDRNKLRKREQHARKKEEELASHTLVNLDPNVAIGERRKPELSLFEGEPSGAFQQGTLMSALSKIVPTIVPCFRPVRNITLDEVERIHNLLKKKFSNGNQLLPSWTKRSVRSLVQNRRTRTRRRVKEYVEALAKKHRNAKAPSPPAGVSPEELDFFTRQIADEEFLNTRQRMTAMSLEMVKNRGCGNPLGSGGLERAKAHHTLETGVHPTVAQVNQWKVKAVARYEAGTSCTATERRAGGIPPTKVETWHTDSDGSGDQKAATSKEDKGKGKMVEEDTEEETPPEDYYSSSGDSGSSKGSDTYQFSNHDPVEDASDADEEKEERFRVLAERALASAGMDPDWFDPFLGPQLFRVKYERLNGKKPTLRDLKQWQDAGQPPLH